MVKMERVDFAPDLKRSELAPSRILETAPSRSSFGHSHWNSIFDICLLLGCCRLLLSTAIYVCCLSSVFSFPVFIVSDLLYCTELSDYGGKYNRRFISFGVLQISLFKLFPR